MELCRTHIDPDDLLQEALERAWYRFDTLRDRDHARAWLLRIVFTTFVDKFRKQRSSLKTVPLDGNTDAEADDDATEPLPWERIGIEQLHAAIDRLSDDLRDTYRMFALEGKDYVEIATTLDIPKSTVGTRLVRARTRLRALLSADVEDTQ
jgi:RNA polymerase sigma-70 factor (ECF subfamily)